MSEGCSGSCSSCGGGCGDAKLQNKLSRIAHKVLVMSGKGGVGKSTVAAGLAVTLARTGAKVGLLDVDFHGPSQPTLFNVQHLRMQGNETEIFPLEVAGLKLVSLGLLLAENDQAVIWRGAAKIGALKQLIEDTAWGDLDYLVLDFPPGTGDEVLSACQMITGSKQAVVVTTPQEVSLADCRKCLDFCRQLEVKVTGVVENMSGFVCPDCGHRHDLFSSGGGARMADAAGLPLLAQLPLDPAFLQQCDQGNIAAAVTGSSEIAAGFKKIAAAVLTADDAPAAAAE